MHCLQRWRLPQPANGRQPACLSARRGAVSVKARQREPIPPPTKLDHFGFSQGFFEKYELTDFIGSGTFGSVHVARHKKTGEKFAVKSAVKRRMGNYLQHDFVRRIQHEVDMGNHLGRSLNVVHLYEVFEDDKSVYLVMDLCSGGELWTRIKQGHFSEQKAARIIAEILRTIAQCHARGVVIRDVKPENFLFQDESPNSPLKMVDFGLAEYCAPNQQLHDRAGTAIYCAPELLRSNYSFKADVWSAGVIAYELLADRLPFEDDDGDMLVSNLRNTHHNLANKEVFHAILYRPLDFEQPPWPLLSASAKDLVQRLLTRDPGARPTALEALHHPWLESATSEQESSRTQAQGGQGSDSALQSEGGGLAGQVARDGSASTSSYDDTLVQRLQQFGTYNRIKQVALAKLASFMAEHDNAKLAALKEAFADRDESGKLSDKLPYDKAVRILKSGDFDLSDIEVRQLLSSFHLDAQGCIDINEWLAALIDWREVQASDEWDDLIARVFDTFDVDHSGRLGASELESLLCDEECPMEDTVPAAMRAAEADAITSMDSMDWAGTGRGSSADSENSQDTSTVPEQNGLSAGQQQGGSQQMGGIDLPAFAKLLRTAQQDRLDLYESRRTRRKES